MKRTFSLMVLIFLCAVSMVPAGVVFAEEPRQQGEQKDQAAQDQGKGGLFMNFKKDPGSGMPKNRIALASRGKADEDLYVVALAPETAGLTVSEQPALCWFLSRPTEALVEVTMSDETSPQPIVEKKFPKMTKGGIQCLKLSETQVKLKPGVNYDWFVSVVVNPEQRSKDISASAALKLVVPSKELAGKLATLKGLDVASAYAAEGIWYDALSTLTNLIDASPADKKLRQERAHLFEQVNLEKVAQHDKAGE